MKICPDTMMTVILSINILVERGKNNLVNNLLKLNKFKFDMVGMENDLNICIFYLRLLNFFNVLNIIIRFGGWKNWSEMHS